MEKIAIRTVLESAYLLTVPHTYSFSESEMFWKVSFMYSSGVTVSITLVSTFIGLPDIMFDSLTVHHPQICAFEVVDFYGTRTIDLLDNCDAPRLLRQVSSSYSLLLPSLFLVCCILPCHHVHCIIMFSKLASVRVSLFSTLSVLSPDTLARAPRHLRNIIL